MTSRKTLVATLSAAAIAFAQTGPRFDHLVRNDYFAGFAGDKAALDRAFEKTGAVLEKDPKHAEAMVWHGAGIFYQSGMAFRGGDQQKGMELFSKGTGMMEQAVKLAPDSVAVRVPRGAILLQSTVQMPPAVAKPLIENGLSDYLRAYEIQKGEASTMGEHPKGELFFGIADAYRRLGNEEKATEWFTMTTKALPGTNYAKRANVWLETKTLTPAQVRCVGCHVDK